jgi:osmoprotectant transport system permease protein
MLHSIIQFITDPANQFGFETLRMIELAVVPTLLAMVIAIPLGILFAQRPVPAFVATNTSNLVRAIPTLAFLAAVVPILGIGLRPSIVALTAIGVSPILLNTIAGLQGIDPAVTDAGRGMGMTSLQILTRIQIPLVLPVIAAGVRSAAVQIVATTPLAALIGGGGYGDYIIGGIGLLADRTELLVGAGGVAALALVTEFGVAAVQRAVTPAGLRVSAEQELAEAQPDTSEAAHDQPAAA